MPGPIRLVAGLGNPGRGYAATRHNAGFWFADALASKLGASFAHEAKFSAEVAKAGDVRIAKPMTYMNLSGRAVAGIARFFDIAPEAILVVHDELDLRPGKANLAGFRPVLGRAAGLQRPPWGPDDAEALVEYVAGAAAMLVNRTA